MGATTSTGMLRPAGTAARAGSGVGHDVEQEIQFYTTADGTRIAYMVLGRGPALVAAPAWLSHLSFTWEEPAFRTFYQALAQRFTVVLYDRHGCGLSDRDRTDYSVEQDVRVLESLVDHLKLRRFTLWGVSTAGLLAILYATRHPRRLSHLILFGAWACGSRAPVGAALKALLLAHWGLGSRTLADWFLPGAEPAAIEWFARLQRTAAAPEMALALMEAAAQVDVADLLPQVHVPTLVINRRDDPITPLATARELAASIPRARLAPVEGNVHVPEFGDTEPVLQAINEFAGVAPVLTRLTLVRQTAAAAEHAPERPPVTAHTISGREVEVLRLVASGLSNKDIAEQLVLSIHTVERHLANIYTKIGARSRTEAATYAIDQGITSRADRIAT